MQEWINGLDQEMLTVWSLRIIYALAILFVGRLLAKMLSGLIAKVLSRTIEDEALVSFFRSVVYTLLLLVVLIATLEQLGINTTSLVAIVGAAGLAIGLALKDSLQNVASGVILIVNRPFKAGDYVDAGGHGGTVEQVGLFTTQLRTLDNCELIVPNSQITSASIQNYTASDNRRLDLVVGISYEDDVKKAKKVALDIMAADSRVLKDPEPMVSVGDLGESSVDLHKAYAELAQKG